MRPSVVALLTLLLVAGAPTAGAQCAGFSDVPTTSGFCANVAWIKNRNITQGCAPGLYCPNDPVTRLQMAAFLNRLGDALLPTTCAVGQVLKWNGTAWACAADAGTGGVGGGPGRRGLVDTLHGSAGTGEYASIAIGQDGLPLVAYYDQGNGDLRLLRCADAGCAVSTSVAVDTVGNVGQWPSLTVRNDGRPAISYYDVGNSALKVAICADAACTTAATFTVDNAADVGKYSAIVNDWGINPQGITVVYYDATNRNLKAAACGFGASCAAPTVVTVAATGDVGQWAAVTVDGYGFLTIAYYDASNRQVMLASCVFAISDCAAPFVRTLADVAPGTADSLGITTSGSGFPVVAYMRRGEAPFDQAFVATCDDTSCTTPRSVPVNLNFGTGLYPAQRTGMATGPDGVPIAFFGLSPSTSCATATLATSTNYAVRCTDPQCTAVTFASHAAFGMSPSATHGVDGLPIFAYHRCGSNVVGTLHCANAACAGAWRRP